MGTIEVTGDTYDDGVEMLRSTPAFAGMETDALQALMAAGLPRNLAESESLFSAGEAFHRAVYVLVEGQVEVRRESGRTESPPPGYFLGLSSYLADSPYASTAVALTDAAVLEVPATELQRLERAHPALFDALNRLIANGLRQRRASHRGVSSALARPVGEIMLAPLVTCPPDLTLTEALRTMLERKIGSLVIVEDGEKLTGVVTFRTVAARLVKAGAAAADTLTVRQASREPVTVPPTIPIWQAESIQEQAAVKYLIVAEGDQPVGMVSQSDIVRALASHHDTLAATIAHTDNLDELAAIVADMAAVASEALEYNRHAHNAVRGLSEGHLAVQRRCLELTLDELEAEGLGGPPAPYAFIIMGSGGRKEMLLNPDQDNGLILADGPGADAETTQAWFQAFAERSNQNLDRVGYILCPGEIMARNPMFHKTLAQWKHQISHIAKRPNEKAARWSNIVFDFRTLHGDDGLTQDLRHHINDTLAEHPRLLQLMVEDDAEGRPPIGLFNRLLTSSEPGEKGKVDVKRNGMRIIADAARIFALRAGIFSCNTNDRLKALVRGEVLGADFVATVSAAYDELLDIVLTHQINQLRAGVPLDKQVAPDDLDTHAREALRVAMRAVKRFQDHLQDELGELQV